MAVYSKLLLSAGGGIVSSMQQAEQAKNTATVLIGLGGTGIDALRTIKTQVYSRLRPDDPDAVVPRYDHIRFLGIDTADKSRGDADDESMNNMKEEDLMPLEDTECFPISNPNVKRTLSNRQSMEMREDLTWLRWEDIDAPNLTIAGAGGIRQVGRFMMMDRSGAFLSRIEQEINAAKSGLTRPTVNVHVFAGLSGGTGSGCFLDVCYMIRHIANKIGGVTIYGYFYLPDVNLSAIPMSNTKVRAYIPKNGYAAMQELDYCMQLQFNGGSFVQKYQNHVDVEWREPPVDMCHLICATDAQNNVIENAYHYAMNVTAEYIMDFLTHSGERFGLDQHLANFTAMVGAGNGEKVIGSHLAYCVIGASCASIPLREINTYLASELFNRFSKIGTNLPTQADVEHFAARGLTKSASSIFEVYESLRRELWEGVDSSYASYMDDWKFVRDYGNRDMVLNYTNQTAEKLNVCERNTRSMISPDNQKSIISRVRAALANLILDINYGPIFAHGLISAARSHNLLNIVDGLLEENRTKWDQEAAQASLRVTDYETAKADFEKRRKRAMFDSDAKRFEDYEHYLMLFEQHKLFMSCYDKLNTVLITLRKQLEEARATYYLKLSRVTETLINSFKENRDALASEKIMQAKGSFCIPLMTIAELKPTLDEQIAQINVPGMLDSFMRVLLQNESVWMAEDEFKIAKLVNTFFVNTAFGDFANRTITAFLKDKYGITDDAQLANKIYHDWMKKLTAKASPLFFFNQAIWSEDRTAKLAFVSIPEASAPVKAAATQMYETDQTWQVKDSALTDRIFVMCSACALPLSAYNNCAEYEKDYFSAPETGRHFYEGKPVEGMAFTDWRQLSSLTPQSMIEVKNLPDTMKNIICSARALYEEAAAKGIFDDENRICSPEPKGVEELRTLVGNAKLAAGNISKMADIPEAKALLAKLNASTKIPMVPTGHAMQNDGHGARRETKLSVQKDHFVSAVPYHAIVRKILDDLATVEKELQEAIDQLSHRISKVEGEGRAINDYCDALFTGVITLEGRVIKYCTNQFGIQRETVLSMRGAEFPFNTIPVYQAFLSYMALPSEVKEEIHKKVDDRYNKDDAAICANGNMLKAELADHKIQAWVMCAEQFSEYKEILDFTMKVKQQFSIFCMSNGI